MTIITDEILFHKEGDNHFNLDIINNYPISTIIYGKICFLLNQLNNLNPEGFFIVPTYKTKNKKQIQLAVTGKFKKNETPENAIRREVAEELGLNVNFNPLNIINIHDNQNELYFSILTSDNISCNNLIIKSNEIIPDNPKKK